MSVAAAALALLAGAAAGPRGPRPAARPSIVLFLCDDLDLMLGGMDSAHQPTHIPALRARGAEIPHWFAHTPVCCPSRSEYLSGRYAHNIRDNHFENSFDCDDYNLSAPITCGCMRMNSTIDSFENAHYGNLLQQHGYLTAYFGKYLNPPAMEP